MPNEMNEMNKMWMNVLAGVLVVGITGTLSFAWYTSGQLTDIQIAAQKDRDAAIAAVTTVDAKMSVLQDEMAAVNANLLEMRKTLDDRRHDPHAD